MRKTKNNSLLNEETLIKLKLIKLKSNNLYYKSIIILFFFILLFNLYNFLIRQKSLINKETIYNRKNLQLSKIIDENFFIIDSNNLYKIKSHMYGFSVSRKGILTNNYYKKLGYYEDPEPQGVYIMIRKKGDEITINQDYSGSFGLYIYENKNTGYFVLSNSFLLLEEYLIDKENITLNKDFSDNLIISGLCTPSIYETLINEINIIPSNSFIIINSKKKEYKIYYIDYKEKTIPFDSEEGLKIIDKWIDKWGYIFRSLKKKTDNISSDLSGGFDSRVILSILLDSGLDINEIFILSINNSQMYEEDFKIARNISSKLGFKLNNWYINNKGIKLSTKDSLFCSIYSKLGLTNWFRSPNKFLKEPKFAFSGFGGENIRGYPGYTIKEYIEKISMGYIHQFYNSSVRICNRSISLLKMKKTYYNDYEVSTDFYLKGRTRHHFGKTALEVFLGNEYILYPLIDPDIMQVKYDLNPESINDLIAYIYVRLVHNLIYLPFSGNREISKESISKAEKLNKKFGKYIIKSDYNQNFYIDINRKWPIHPASPAKENHNITEYLKYYFNSSKLIKIINKVYDKNIYYKAKKSKKNYREISLYAVAKILEDLSMKNLNC
jgi:hypothetical protein